VFCSSCGKNIPEDARFCPKCGAITITESPTTQNAVDGEPKAKRRISRKSFLVSTVVILALLVSSVVVFTIRSNDTNGVSSSPISERLPLYVCKTSLALPTMKAKNLPSHEIEMVPPASAGKLAIYSDSMGIMKLLGPVGWGCSAAVGVDGSSGLTVTPTNSGIWTNSDRALSTSSKVEEVNGSQTGAATGSALEQACPFFKSAEQRWADVGSTCPATPLPETATPFGENAVEFIDPPHVYGTGDPSGGAYPASGVVIFHPNGWQEPQSSIETCVLPPSQHSLCSASLHAFALNYGIH